MPSPDARGEKSGRRRPRRASRYRLKRKRLDAIIDVAIPPPPLAADDVFADDDPLLLRRSSRVRRAPVVLDSSPVPFIRRKPQQPLPKEKSSDAISLGLKRNDSSLKLDGGGSGAGAKEGDAEAQDWRSRLRSRVMKRKHMGLNLGVSLESDGDENAPVRKRKRNQFTSTADPQLFYPPTAGEGRKRDDKIEGTGNNRDNDFLLVSSEQEEEESEDTTSPSRNNAEQHLENDVVEENDKDEVKESEALLEQSLNIDGSTGKDAIKEDEVVKEILHTEDVVKDGDARLLDFSHVPNKVGKEILHTEDIVKDGDARHLDFSHGPNKNPAKEGRRCGLCGGGTDGRPPKKLAPESMDSDKEAYEGMSASEELNYDTLDGFSDEPGWLGRLLGPTHDQFGIARVWVHLYCAVWSPEVYFAGLGHLKNVRAALSRGRALKCCRCGRPGATIGCRVDRCPKTYHLPCSRAEGCIFDHRKFLIACSDHLRLFQPQGNNYTEYIKKMKVKKLQFDLQKLSGEALRRDLEAEEKLLENCGEDEEFLRREGRRLHRDILRIKPVYVGGSLDSEKLYQGWESVAGLQDVIRCLKEVVIIPLLYPEFFRNMGLTPPRGVLLHGYPGTGKTLVVRALIGACSLGDKRIAYFARKGADCLGKYVGDAERQLRLLFQVAERSQPSIIFFDEIDGLAPRRSGHLDQTHCSVVSTLLSLMDGLKSRGSVIVIGATNRPDALDPALRRPGRFDREIYFPLPSAKDRAAILSLHTRNWSSPSPQPLLSWIASETAGYAGADLQSLCAQAALNALKRNCALQEILSSVEKNSSAGRLPCLPLFSVEKRDWLAALKYAPPPCSRREAGMAANDVVSSPLHGHLVTFLLEPLSHLLIALYADVRVNLPPSLLEAARSLRNTIFSSLELKEIPVRFWHLQLHSLLQEPCIAKEMEEIFYKNGFLLDQAGEFPCHPLVNDNDDGLIFSSCESAQRVSFGLQRTLGFRVLIAGIAQSGQQHLARCLLHGFTGHIHTEKVNLATISQVGRGDVILGIIHILSKCVSLDRCIIYMPRIDLWAIDDRLEDGEDNIIQKRTKPSRASEAWSAFIEQVGSSCTSSCIIILATCEVSNSELPFEIRRFFSCMNLNNSDPALTEYPAPRFSISLNGTFDIDLMINSAAANLSKDIVRHYVQLVYHETHMTGSPSGIGVPRSTNFYSDSQNHQSQEGPATVEPDASLDLVKTACCLGGCYQCRETQCSIDTDFETSKVALNQDTIKQESVVELSNLQDSIPKAILLKTPKGTASLAVSSFGYQVLRYPHFAELCWVTSKLKSGPYTKIVGPRKSWPFNACMIHSCCSSDKTHVSGSSGSSDKESCVAVRGLVAVGLMAYRGVYASARQVASEVRKVLELLVEDIRSRILCKKDRYRYIRLLSQVAYLEDIVNCWAYTLPRVQTDNQETSSITKCGDAGKLSTCHTPHDSNPSDGKSPVIIDVESHLKISNCNGIFLGDNRQLSESMLVDSDKGIAPESVQNQETPVSNQDVGNENGTASGVRNSHSRIAAADGGNGSVLDEVSSISNCAPYRRSNQSSNKGVCFFGCCSRCRHLVNELTQSILSNSCKSGNLSLTLEGLHGAITSTCVSILADFKKHCTINGKNSAIIEQQTKRFEEQGCDYRKNGLNHTKDTSMPCVKFLPTKCSCHGRNAEEIASGETGRHPLFFSFKDGMLLSSEEADKEDASVHCRLENMCVHPVINILRTMKHPS